MPIVLGVIAVIVIAFVAVVATRPDSFRIERSAHVNAAPDVVFGLLNDFHQWPLWSPWEKIDLEMKRSYTGAGSGPGAVYDWSGNNKAGVGRMTILDSTPGQQIRIKLDFIKPFTATNQITYQLVAAGGGTQVSWIMEGEKDFKDKAMHLFMNMDKLIGKDFEQGLVNLNTLASKQ